MSKFIRLRLMAVFMIALILTLPVAFSQQLSITQVSGDDGIDGYAKRNDALVVKVTAAITGNPPADIAATRVRLYTSPTRFVGFDTCTKGSGNFYDCELRDEQALRNVVGSAGYEIRLVDADGSTVESIPRSLVIDSQAPVVQTFAIDPAVTRDPTVTFSYLAEDYAASTGDTSDCSGIQQVEFIVDGNVIATQAGSVNECRKQQAFTHNFNVNGTLNQDVCAQATDFFGRTSSLRCSNVRVDNTGPVIEKLEVRSPQGFQFTHIRSGANTVGDVTVLIRGDGQDIDSRTVRADLSSLNPTLAGMRPADRFSAPVNGSISAYVWRNINIVNPQSCSVSVSATDDIGNSATNTLTCELPVDDEGPTVQTIRADSEQDGKIVLPAQGTLYVDIEDLDSDGNAGIGFQEEHAYLDLRTLGLDSRTAPTSCEQSGSVWTCLYDIEPTVNSGEYDIGMSLDTRDDLGNLMTNQQVTKVVFDKDAPVIRGITEYSVIHEGARTTGFAVRGDTVEIRVTAEDFSRAAADFTDLGLGEIEALQCDVKNGTKEQSCVFSAVVDTSGPYTAEVFLTFSDDAGNEAIEVHEIEVLGIEDEANPNYWEIDDVDCSPRLVDRSMTDLINYPVYCQINLDPLLTGGSELLPGAMIVDVFPGGAAAAAGLGRGDVILRYNGNAVPNVRALLQQTTRTSRSDTVSALVEINGTEETIQLRGGGMGARMRTNREKRGAPQVVAVDIADFTTDCTGDLSGYVQEIGMINNQLGTTDPIMTVRLATSDFNVEEVVFSCPIRIFSQVGDAVTQNPEVEEVEVKIQFYNQPLGAMAENIDKKVDKAVERADSFLSWIDDIQTIMEYAELICQAWNTLVTIVSTLASVVSISSTAADAVTAIPGLSGAGDALNEASKNICNANEVIREEITKSTIGELANEFCAFITCQKGLLDLPDLIADEGSEPGYGSGYRAHSNTIAAEYLSLGIADTSTGANPIGGSFPSDATAQLQNPGAYLNVKDSLVYSVLIPPLCVPGIIHNLNKLRQIECRYALCMSRDVRNGLPISTCNDAKHYQICRFVVGEIFNVIPFAPLVNHYIGMITNLLNDPLVLAVTVVGYLIDCKQACSIKPGKGPAYVVCSGLAILDLVGRSINNVRQITENSPLASDQPQQWCEQLEDFQNDLEKNKQQGQGSATAFGGSP